jgi:hydrogenase/urease accessory protein HupE
MSRLLIGIVAGLALCAAVVGRAAAHPLTPALLDLEEGADGVTTVTWKTSASQIAGVVLTPRLPAGCVRDGTPTETMDRFALAARWTVHCGPGGLVGQEIGIDGLPDSKTDALLRISLADGRLVQAILRPDEPSLVVPAQPTRLDVLRNYGRLGIEHILSGPDHLLFVFGLLLLVATTRALVRTITAFTVGHSITLSLAALGYARVPSGPIEVLIALSVFVLAVDLAQPGDPSDTVLGRRPWMMAALFGLLHGLGFASALREAGLPQHEIPAALLSFNVGIEIGQLAFVAVILLVRRATRSLLTRSPSWLQPAPVYVMGSLAALWVIERSFALL